MKTTPVNEERDGREEISPEAVQILCAVIHIFHPDAMLVISDRPEAAVMALSALPEGTVSAVVSGEARARAEAVWTAAGMLPRIRLCEGSPAEVLGRSSGRFDFILLDGRIPQADGLVPALADALTEGGFAGVWDHRGAPEGRTAEAAFLAHPALTCEAMEGGGGVILCMKKRLPPPQSVTQ